MIMDLMPKEIWCTIFSYLDEKSIRNATLTCKFWFELIRSDCNFSSHVVLKRIGLEELGTKIENLEWVWSRWPKLKTLEFEVKRGRIPFSASEAMDTVKSIKFELCPTLESVIIDVEFLLRELSKNIELKDIGIVKRLNFNPRANQTMFGMEHVLSLFVTLRDSQMADILKTLDFIGQNAKCLRHLEVTNSDQRSNMKILKVKFENMFKGMADTLKTLKLYNYNHFDGSVFETTILNALNANCDKLENLTVQGVGYASGLPELDCKFKSLRSLTIPTFLHIDCFLNTCEKLNELCVEKAVAIELKNFDVPSIKKRFKNIRKIQIYVLAPYESDLIQCSEWTNALKMEDRDIIKVHYLETR